LSSSNKSSGPIRVVSVERLAKKPLEKEALPAAVSYRQVPL